MVKGKPVRVAILDFSEGDVIISALKCANDSESIELELSKLYNLGDINWMMLREDNCAKLITFV